MKVSVANQADIFLIFVAGGMIAAFIYDLFRIKRRVVHTCDFLVHLEDLSYWILIAVLFFICVYFSNDGEIRGYMFIGAIIGAVFYALTFSRIVMKILVAALNFTVAIIKAIIRILKYPINILSGASRRVFMLVVENIARVRGKK